LIKAMAENLSADDRPFLEGLTKDRAPSVREAADRLLARMPGSPQAAKHLQDCLSRIKRAKAGLLRRRVTLQLAYPATVKEWQREAWAIATVGTIALDDFAKGLALTVDELVGAAADDQVLMMVLAAEATQARRHDVLAEVVRNGAANAWAALVQVDDLEILPEAAAAWSAAAIQPDLWADLPVAALTRLYEKLRQPLPQPTPERLLAASASPRTLQ